MQDPVAYFAEFEKRKIVIPAIVPTVSYAISDGFFSNDKTAICIADDPEFVLGLLNSAVLWWVIKSTAATKQGGFYEFKPMYVTQLPIPDATPAEQAAIASLVEAILAAKSADAGANVLLLEREIDDLVANLYGLDVGEKKLVGLV